MTPPRGNNFLTHLNEIGNLGAVYHSLSTSGHNQTTT